jgi:predicted nucleic acid-binding protein
MGQRLIMVDTSAIYALLDRSDKNHPRAVQILQNIQRKNKDILLTNFILAECHALLLSKLGAEIAREWLKNNIWPVISVTETDEEMAKVIILGYTDKKFSLTDATTFAVMKRLQIDEVFSFDRHFTQFGFQLSM